MNRQPVTKEERNRQELEQAEMQEALAKSKVARLRAALNMPEIEEASESSPAKNAAKGSKAREDH